MSNYAPTPEKLVQLYAQMADKHGYTVLAKGGAEAWLQASPYALLLVGDNPMRFAEVWDVAVLLPDLVALIDAELRRQVQVGLSHPGDANSLIAQYRLHRVPALVAFKYGAVQGRITGVQDWSAYRALVPLLWTGAA